MARPPAPRLDLYIYYKVAEDNAAALLPRVRAMQAQLAPACASAPQLKRRAEAPDGVQTWMEIYPGAAPGLPDALIAAVCEAGLDTLGIGARHCETFMDINTCA